MKIRTDFVTNSSSSSFIIDKSEFTVESVYKIIRELHLEYAEKLEELIKWSKKNGTGLRLKKINSIIVIERSSNASNCISNYELDKEIQKLFEISLYDLFPENSKWTKCKKYKEYIEYFKCNGGFPPFVIIDFTQKKSTEGYDASEVLDWFTEDGTSEAFRCKKDNTESCNYCSYQNGCKEARKYIKDNNIKTIYEMCENMLGKICIESYCGNIPQYVVNRLAKMSKYSCNHMG